ncbi:MAG: M23 family metallopeptidase, partial [Bacteroidetes bacterium]|nr:M23 family metallopeptidase [Bacteroidota bacterium]
MASGAFSQEKYPQTDFISPVDFGISLSGTFGELRSGHFHSGMDIRTQGTSGLPLRAVADGYVSRINISPGGFGKTLYISHPNGYMSVYAHLNNFSNVLDAYVKKEQYRLEQFSVNLFPGKEMFPVKQGDIIGYSGNSGYSFGPHLHFEIREDATQIPMNPLLFGFRVTDGLPPVMQGIRVYPEKTKQEGITEFKLLGSGNKYYLPGKDTLFVTGDFFLGIRVYDQINGSGSKNGIHRLSIFLDTLLYYEHIMDRFSFNDTRYINSLIDYREYILSDRRFMRTRVDPNNRLKIYRKIINDGIFSLPDSLVHQITVEASDIAGNTSVLRFPVMMRKDTAITESMQKDSITFPVSWRDETILEFDGVKLIVPPYALYDHLELIFNSSERFKGSYSKLYSIHNKTVPVHKYMELSIPVISLPESLREKALLVKTEDKEKELVSAGGAFSNGFVKGRIREFGDYAVMVDTIPPEIVTNGKGPM